MVVVRVLTIGKNLITNVITKFVLLAKNGKQIICGVLTGVLLFSTVGYLGKSVDSWFGDIKDQDRFQGLDAAAFVHYFPALDF